MVLGIVLDHLLAQTLCELLDALDLLRPLHPLELECPFSLHGFLRAFCALLLDLLYSLVLLLPECVIALSALPLDLLYPRVLRITQRVVPRRVLRYALVEPCLCPVRRGHCSLPYLIAEHGIKDVLRHGLAHLTHVPGKRISIGGFHSLDRVGYVHEHICLCRDV